jgi:hypothetical protein
MLCRNVGGDAPRDFDVKCAWCGRVIRGSKIKDSHGMCDECYRRELESQRSPAGPRVGGDFGQGGTTSSTGGK